MARHSANSTSRGFHSRKELNKSRLAARKDTAVVAKFGTCHLCHDRLSDTVATKSGHLYHRECIVKYMIAKKKEIKEHNEAVAVEEVQEIEEKPFNIPSSHGELPTSRKRKNEEVETTKKSAGFWLPENAPVAKPSKKQRKLSKHPSSPFSGKPLKLKDLIPVTIDIETQATENSKTGESETKLKSFICHISRRELVRQEVLVDKESGAIVTKSAFEVCIGPVEKHMERVLMVSNLSRLDTSAAPSASVGSSK